MSETANIANSLQEYRIKFKYFPDPECIPDPC